MRWFLAFWIGLIELSALPGEMRFAYDGHIQSIPAYDSSRESLIGYDAVLEHATDETRNGTAGTRVLFAKCAGFVAAQTEASLVRGWKVGDPINNLTAKGNVPTWSAVRQRILKNEAFYKPEAYPGNLERMKRGLAPQRINPTTGELESMTFHHDPPQRAGGLFDVEMLWPDDHAIVDSFYKTKK